MIKKKEKKWRKPIIKHGRPTKYNYVVHYPQKLKIGKNFDIGIFTYINSRYGVEIGDNVKIGSHCSIYSHSTIDNKHGKVILKNNCRIGTHSTIMPNVTIGKNAIVAAYSFVNRNISDNEMWAGVPAQFKAKIKKIVK